MRSVWKANLVTSEIPFFSGFLGLKGLELFWVFGPLCRNPPALVFSRTAIFTLVCRRLVGELRIHLSRHHPPPPPLLLIFAVSNLVKMSSHSESPARNRSCRTRSILLTTRVSELEDTHSDSLRRYFHPLCVLLLLARHFWKTLSPPKPSTWVCQSHCQSPNKPVSKCRAAGKVRATPDEIEVFKSLRQRAPRGKVSVGSFWRLQSARGGGWSFKKIIWHICKHIVLSICSASTRSGQAIL